MGGAESNGHSDLLFSVVIPSHRADQLGAALHALGELDYPPDLWEAVVVLDGGDDGMAEGVRREHPHLPLRMIPQPQSGPANARNTGAMEARGEFIAFTDDDCAPRSDWLAALERCFAGAPGALIGGRTVNGLPENRYSEASQRVVDAVYHYYNPDPHTTRFLTTSNLAVPAGTYRELGGFDPSFPLAAAEDRDFCDRWNGAGHPLVYAPDAVVMHFHRMTLRGLARQQHNYGRGAAHYRRARRRRGEPREQVSIRFYRDLLKVAAGDGPPVRRLADVALVVAAQAVYAAGYVTEELRERLRRH